MRLQEPLPHWINFTIPQLEEVLQHCAALEKLGIAQDSEMIASIERDVALRAKEVSRGYAQHVLGSANRKRKSVQNQNKLNKTIGKTQPKKQQPQSYLLEQTA